jgi:hypothetical protein
MGIVPSSVECFEARKADSLTANRADFTKSARRASEVTLEM